MKKITIYSIAFILIGLALVIADLSPTILDRTIILDKEKADNLISRGITKTNITDIKIGSEQIKRTIYQEGAIDTFIIIDTFYYDCEPQDKILNQCSKKAYYSSEILKQMLDEEENKIYDRLATAETNITKEIIRKGQTTLNTDEK